LAIPNSLNKFFLLKKMLVQKRFAISLMDYQLKTLQRRYRQRRESVLKNYYNAAAEIGVPMFGRFLHLFAIVNTVFLLWL